MIKTRSVINCKIAYNKIAIYLFLSVELINLPTKYKLHFIMAIKLKIGSPVVGEDFFGREVELKKANP